MYLHVPTLEEEATEQSTLNGKQHQERRRSSMRLFTASSESSAFSPLVRLCRVWCVSRACHVRRGLRVVSCRVVSCRVVWVLTQGACAGARASVKDNLGYTPFLITEQAEVVKYLLDNDYASIHETNNARLRSCSPPPTEVPCVVCRVCRVLCACASCAAYSF
jgi:hypothetical protein